MKLNKKYFLAIFTMFGIQLGFGVNSALAVPCEDKVDSGFAYNGDYGPPEGKVWEYLWGNTHAKYTSVEDAKNKLYDTAVRYIDNRYEGNRGVCVKEIQYETNGGIELIACMNQVLANNGCDASVFKRNKSANPNSKSNNSSSNQSSKPVTSKQSKSSQQATSSQSKQSNTDDVDKKSLNEAIDIANNADTQKDYAKAIPALKSIIASSKDKPLKAAATNKLGEYYKFGHGVQKDEVKAQALFEQASFAGDADADAHIGENYQDGTGGVIKNHQTAIRYFTAAAAKGHVVAMSKLGYLYHAGIGTINPELGNEWICKAAKKGDSIAIGNAEKLKLNCN